MSQLCIRCKLPWALKGTRSAPASSPRANGSVGCSTATAGLPDRQARGGREQPLASAGEAAVCSGFPMSAGSACGHPFPGTHAANQRPHLAPAQFSDRTRSPRANGSVGCSTATAGLPDRESMGGRAQPLACAGEEAV